MKYMFLLYGSELPEPGTDEARTLIEQWSTARQAMADAGVLVDCAPLHPSAASTTVRARGGGHCSPTARRRRSRNSSAGSR